MIAKYLMVACLSCALSVILLVADVDFANIGHFIIATLVCTAAHDILTAIERKP